MTLLLQQAIAALNKLKEYPEDEQNAIAAKVITLLGLQGDVVHNDYNESIENHNKERTPGLELGTIIIADDFNDPLPDSFWLGEE